MATELPGNLVGNMMSSAPKFTLPNFGAQNRPSQRGQVAAPLDAAAASPAPRPAAHSVRKPRPAAQSSAKMKFTYSTSDIEDEILERMVMDLRRTAVSRRDVSISRVIEDALRPRIVNGRLDLSILGDPRIDEPVSRRGRCGLMSPEVFKDFWDASMNTRFDHPEIPAAKLKLTSYLRACILTLG